MGVSKLGAPVPMLENSDWLLLCLVVAVIGQQVAICLIRRREAKREQLFRIITENAADMIALVDMKGRREYNSPAYERVLGYSQSELASTSIFDQVHPDDRVKVLDAARLARQTGVGKRLQYRLRHKDGTWRVLESTANTIKNSRGEVEKLVIVNRDITDRRQAEQQLEHSSLHDGLTGLANRRLCIDRIQRNFTRQQRDPNYHYAILLIALDDFTRFDESLGPDKADQVIAEIGRRLQSELRLDDTISRPAESDITEDALLSRFETSEFTVLLENAQSPSDAMRVAHRVQAAISRPIALESGEFAVSASIGIALSTSPHENAADLLRDAAIATRRAQVRGGGRCEIYDELMHTRAVRRLTLESELSNALKQSQFILHYQPMFRLEDRQLLGFEALLRWKHPQKGIISPFDFLNVAEDTGLITSIDQWVIEQACFQLNDWRNKLFGPRTLRISVNLSARQLANLNLVQEFRTVTSKLGISPGQIQIEIAEHVAMADPELTGNVLLQFKHLGVGRILDNFGSGQSSLSCLQRLPLSALKIDRSVVSNMAADRHSHEVLGLIHVVARALKLDLAAEGIEAISQIDPLIDAGCIVGQGYLFSQPLEAAQAEKLLSAR